MFAFRLVNIFSVDALWKRKSEKLSCLYTDALKYLCKYVICVWKLNLQGKVLLLRWGLSLFVVWFRGNPCTGGVLLPSRVLPSSSIPCCV